MTRLLIVTGVSCAGKTTLGQALADHDGKVRAWWDLDNHAEERPKTAQLDWLRWRAATCLHDATEMAEMGDACDLIVVTGIVWPFALIESPAWPAAAKNPDLAVGWLMLDPPWRVLRQRLDVRTAADPKQDQRDLRAYNRQLRKVIRRQVSALRDSSVSSQIMSPAAHALEILGLAGIFDVSGFCASAGDYSSDLGLG